MIRLTAPGSILLMGEYAVLEEGGLGVALAVERRVRISVEPASRLLVEGVWPEGGLRWTGPQDGNPVISETVAGVTSWLNEQGHAGSILAAEIRIDSTELFGDDGRKAGFGSSAAVAVGLTGALLRTAEVAVGAPLAVEGDRIMSLALGAHRRAQGGGSGYDVYTTYHGDAGVFHGGRLPSWEPCPAVGLLQLSLFPGKAAVSTPDSVRRYQAWKSRDPAAARELLDRSNTAVAGFQASTSPHAALHWLAAARAVGIELGDRIGVPARIQPPPGADPRQCKAVGAGNELGVSAFPSGSRPPEVLGLKPLTIARQGLTRE